MMADQMGKTLHFENETNEPFDPTSKLSTPNGISDDLSMNSEMQSSKKSLLLNKILENPNPQQINLELSSKTKRPIPKPRKSKKNNVKEVESPSSQKTYIVENIKPYIESVQVMLHTTPGSSSTHVQAKNSSDICKTSVKSINEDAILSVESMGTTNLISIIENNDESDKLTAKKLAEDNKDNECNYNYEKIVEIIVHKTDNLQLDSYVTHPMVKVHIVDMNTGKYYLKSNKNRSVVFYYENEEQDYILPVMTHSYNLQEKRTFSPQWEESILLNEDFNYLVNENVVIFFEVLDYVPFVSKKFHEERYCYKGWHTITFAFLKVVGRYELNVNKKVKLQLYYPKSSNKHEPDRCDLWYIWKTNKLKKYPSALYITVQEVISPKNIIETFRSKTPLQKENVFNLKSKRKTQNLKKRTEKHILCRSFAQTFELPNTPLAELDSYDKGCFILKFSNNGLYLACAVQMKDSFTVVIYKVNSLEEECSVNEHRGLIYTINWSSDDSLLLTSSADNTVVIWNFATKSFLQILPHPIYVYGTNISSDKTVIATGCYDKIIRMWLFNHKEEKYELHQELEKHNGFVTSISFNNNSTKCYSSDSTGHIIEWSKIDNFDWQFERDITTPDLSHTVINEILLFSNDTKLLVHSRDSVLRILSTKRPCVLHWLQGSLNSRIQTFCSITSCGRYATCGSENGLVVVWDTKTGRAVATYEPFLNHLQLETIHCVQFHPKDNLIAFSHHGSMSPILLYHYDDKKEDIKKPAIQCIFHKDDKIGSVYSEKLSPKKNIVFYDVLDKMDKLLTY